jgi:hypothetical protein
MEQDRTARRDAAARQLNEHEKRSDGNQVVDSLDCGLTLLADLLYSRLHKDVEEVEGLDSMLTPISPSTTQSRGLREISLYQIAESAAFARMSSYTRDDAAWYVQWLSRLRFGEPPPREASRRPTCPPSTAARNAGDGCCPTAINAPIAAIRCGASAG